MKIANNIKVFILLLVGIVLGMSVINVNAATVPTSVKMKSKSLLYYFTEKKKTDYIDGYNFYRKELDDGTLAYCSSNITSHVPAGKTLKLKGEVTDKGLAYIIKNGYPHKSFTGDAKKDYYITQAAVWRYYDETRGSKNWSSSAFKSTSTGMRKYVYDLVQQAKKANSSTSITSSVSATISSDTMTISGNEFVSKQISVSLTNTLSTYTVSLENAPAKTKILDVNGKEKTTFNKGEKFVVTTPISNISGSIKIKISATGVDSKVYEYSTGNSYYQDIIVVTEYETTKDVSTTLKLNFNLNTKVSISKQDITTKKELAGATLIVKDINGKEIDKWVSNGKLHYIENILPGDYTLTEISAPNGYKLSSETVKFTVKTDGTVQSVVMFNEKEITKVSISKQDMANGKELPGATLIVKDANGKEVARWVSTDKPHYIEGLAEGKYTLTEISAPSGYKLSSETISFELKADGTVQGVTMLNEREVTKVSISKQDMANGKELPGATLIVKDANGKEVARWVSTDKPHYIEGLAEGKYTLTEISAPSGYKLSSETISFELKADGKIQSVTMLNAREVTKLRISKKDISTKEELVGATLVVKDSTGKVVDRFTSTGEPHYVEGLAVGSYTLEEEKAPSGYKLSTEKISFRLANDGNVQEVVMYNTKDITRLRISKQDMGTKTELAGATLVIKDKTGKVVTRFVTENTPKYIEGLEPGEYILSEEKAPNGYKLSTETVNFNLKRDGEVKLITFYNVKEVTRIKISKQDITTKKELAGATLVVKDKDGNIVDKWVSTEEPHYIEGLKEGNYTLTEKVAPNGYKLSSETINFTLKADGTIQSVVMYNEKEITKVKISKQDITTKKELPGATLVIKDKSGNVIDTWVSTTEPKYIEGLEPGDYTLTEKVAPNGYELSKETINFTLKADGTIQTVIMYNNKLSVVTKVKISKQDITTKKELPGATLVIKDKSGNVIDTWVSTTEPKYIEGLEPGDYTLTETIAPTGYRLSSETIKFTVNADGSLTSVVMYNSKNVVKLQVSKLDKVTKTELAGATLIIKDKSGNVVDKWISTTTPHYNETLSVGEYTLIEESAPNGYKLNSEVIKFTLTDSDKIQNVVIYNEKKDLTKVRISKQDITSKAELPGATLIVHDKNGNEVDRWVSTTTPHMIEGLAVDEYTLTEIIAPNGYILSTETIKFNVKEDGTVTDVVMYNALKPVSKVLVSKLDKNTGIELAGATLVIKDENGNIVDTWVSGTNAHYIEGLASGVYTLEETEAPSGYALSTEKIKFTVTEDNNITKVVMYNTKLINIPITDLNISTMTLTFGSIITFMGAGIIVFYKKFYI